jgi:hypothetical protein
MLHRCEACGVDCRTTARLYIHMQSPGHCLEKLGINFDQFKVSFRAKLRRGLRRGPLGDMVRRKERESVSALYNTVMQHCPPPSLICPIYIFCSTCRWR